MRWLLDYTAQQSSGIAAWERDTDHIEKGFVFGGMPARSGVTSALLVQSGWTGVDDILSGADNFLLANAPQGESRSADRQARRALRDCAHQHQEVDRGNAYPGAARRAGDHAEEASFEADQVQEVMVRMPATQGSVVNNREMPDICLQHMIAVMLIDKTATFRSAHDKARMQDPAVLRQRAKVQSGPRRRGTRNAPAARARPSWKSRSPTERRSPSMSRPCAAPPGNPMTREEVVSKARELMAPVLGAANCGKPHRENAQPRKCEKYQRAAALAATDLRSQKL